VNWSPQQERALDRVGKWLRAPCNPPKPFLTLAGYSGTGKTTLAKHLAAGVQGKVYFAAFTGKAAHVLVKSGIPEASTIHKLIYLPRDKCSARLTTLKKELEETKRRKNHKSEELRELEKKIRDEQKNLSRPDFTLNYDSPLWGASLLVIDEYSMVDEQMGQDLLQFKCPVLALGDPGQLPPISGRQFFSEKPDVMLEEIHRQAADNPIIRMSKDVREGRALRPGAYGTSRVVSQSNVSDAECGALAIAADQILVGMNNTRRQFNAYVRGLLGKTGPLPEPGDKIVCKRNNSREELLNGQMWTVDKSSSKGKMLQIKANDDDGHRVDCVAHKHRFLGKDQELSEMDPYLRRAANEFDFGYALTVHTAQGSQWDNVMLLDEWRGSSRKEWLYTGITRAAESVTIVQ